MSDDLNQEIIWTVILLFERNYLLFENLVFLICIINQASERKIKINCLGEVRKK